MTAGRDLTRLQRGLLLAYALPGLPLAALLLPLYVTLPTFYAEDLGLGLATTGLTLLAARLWDVITDPLIGTFSDRLQSRFGRRRPWLLAGLPLVLLSVTSLFMPAAQMSWVEFLGWAMALYLGTTMILLPYTAWGAELSTAYHERSRVAAWRESMVVFGTLLAAGLPAVLAGDRRASLEAIGWGLCVLLPLSVAVAVALVPERPASPRNRLPWRRGWQAIRRNGPFRRLIAAYFLNGVANGLPATLFLLFVEHVLERPGWSGVLLLVYFACGIAAIPVWLRLSRRYGKHRVWIGAMLWASAVFLFVPLLGPGDHHWFLLICVLTGASLAADLVLPPAMQADVIDLDTLRSGQRRAGLYFALWGVATKLALALGVGLAFPLLELSGFQTGDAGNSGFALFSLAALYSLLPAAFKLAAVGLFVGYPITAERQARIGRLVAARHGAI